MAINMTSYAPSRPPVFTNQERHVMGQLASMVGALDYFRLRCADLEQRLAVCPESPLRHRLIRDLFVARQGEQTAILNLRDGAAHLTGLVVPIYAVAG